MWASKAGEGSSRGLHHTVAEEICKTKITRVTLLSSSGTVARHTFTRTRFILNRILSCWTIPIRSDTGATGVQEEAIRNKTSANTRRNRHGYVFLSPVLSKSWTDGGRIYGSHTQGQFRNPSGMFR